MAERTIRLGRAIRAARGLVSQKELAERLGVEQPLVSKWENDRRRPSLEELHAIEGALGRRQGFILITAGCVHDVLTVPDAIAVAPISDDARGYLLSLYEQALRAGEP